MLTHYDRLRSLMATVFSEGHGGTKAEVKDLLVPDHMAKASFYTVWNRAYEMHVITRISGTQSFVYTGPPLGVVSDRPSGGGGFYADAL